MLVACFPLLLEYAVSRPTALSTSMAKRAKEKKIGPEKGAAMGSDFIASGSDIVIL